MTQQPTFPNPEGRALKDKILTWMNSISILTSLYKRDRLIMRESFGIPYPEYFTHPASEYNALVSRAALIDLTHWAILRAKGKDSVNFLNSMLTNNVSGEKKRMAYHTAITTAQGKLLAELFVLKKEKENLLLVSQGNREKVLASFEHHIMIGDVVIEDVSSSYGVLAVEGPKAPEVIWRLFPRDPLPECLLQYIECRFEDADITILRNTVTGENGFHLLIPVKALAKIRDFLIQAGRASDMLCLGRVAWNIRRVESGLPWFGLDVTEEDFPQEMRLEYLVGLNKSAFQGEETLFGIEDWRHDNRLLVGLSPVRGGQARSSRSCSAGQEPGQLSTPEGGRFTEDLIGAFDLSSAFPPGTPLYSIEREGISSRRISKERGAVGRITSSVFSLKLGKPLLLGLVQDQLARPDSEMLLPLGNGLLKVKVVDLPVA